MRTTFIILFFLFLPVMLHAQVFPYHHYTTNNGLPHSNVFCMEQDKRGFVWLGTENGLSRFDGREFVNYSVREGMSSNEVTSLALEGDRMWIGLYDRTLNYLEKGRINEYKLDTNASLLFPNLIALNGSVYSGLGSEVREIRQHMLRSYPATVQTGTINCLYNANGKLILGADSGCFILNNGRFQLLAKVSGIASVSLDKNNVLWLGSRGKVFGYDLTSGKIIKELAINGGYRVERLICDSKERLWIWGFSGLGENKLIMIENGREFPIGNYIDIDGLQVNFICEDKQENIWIGTFGKGVYCLYNFFIRNYTMKEGLGNNYVFCMASNKQGELLAGSYKGLSVINKHGIIDARRSKDYPAITFRKLSVENEQLYASGSSYFSENIKQVGSLSYCAARSYAFQNDTLILGGWGNELQYFIRKGETYKFLFNQVIFPNPTGYIRVNVIFRNPEGGWFIGTNKGLCRVQNLPGKTGYVEPVAGHINSIRSDPNGRIWVAGSYGVSFLERDKWIKFNPGSEPFLSATDVEFSEHGQIWIGTLNGLFLCEGKGVKRISKHDGILSDNINALFNDKTSGTLWIGSSEGLSAWKLKDQTKFNNGYQAIIHRVSYGDSTYFDLTTLPVIPFGERNLKIFFSEPEYRNPSGITYQYWFADDPSKKYYTSTPFIQFSAVRPGNYDLYISGSNPDKAAVIHFKVASPFWMKPWFWILCILFAAGILFWVVTLRIRIVRTREEQKRASAEEINLLRHKAVAAMMNPHFIFNSLNTVQHFINSNQPYEANEYLAGFGRLIRINLDIADRSTIPLSEELERLDRYLFLEKLRFGDRLNFKVNIDRSINTRQTLIPNMILQPLAENAIKHGILPSGNNGELIIDIYPEFERIMISIQDNGVGLKPRDKVLKDHNSQGMLIVQERLKLILKDEYVPILMEDLSMSETMQGTRVLISLPVLAMAF